MNDNLPQTHADAVFAANASLFFDVLKFEHGQRVAKMLATSTMIPDAFRNNVGNIMIALNYADRLGVDVFMLMQSMFVLSGKPGIESKMVISMVNQSGTFKGPLQWEWSGTEGQDDWTCTAYATHKKTDERLELSIDWKTVKAEGWLNKNGSKWRTMPKQMFRYRTASWFANSYCPEVKMGIMTTEEIRDLDATELKLDKTKGVYQPVSDKPPEDLYKTTIQPESLNEWMVGNHTWAREKWIHMKSPGYSTYVIKNKATFEEAPNWIQDEAKQKWHSLYPDNPWLMDRVTETEFNAELTEAIEIAGADIVAKAQEQTGISDPANREEAERLLLSISTLLDQESQKEEF
jgi:hypothetical protein